MTTLLRSLAVGGGLAVAAGPADTSATIGHGIGGRGAYSEPSRWPPSTVSTEPVM